MPASRWVAGARIAALALVAACSQQTDQREPPTGAAASVEAPDEAWIVRRLGDAPPRFRPHAWSGETELWGLLRGRLAALDVRTGGLRSFPHEAWSIAAAQGVVSWRNAAGTWLLRGDSARLLAPQGTDPATGFEGPVVALWAPDGRRALLRWEGEWDSVFELLESDGSRRRLDFGLRGYFGKRAALWLESDRVLFEIVASGPRGGEPTYRESGWGTDLAVLDVATAAFSRVVDAPDLARLTVAGRLGDDLLVTEWGDTGVTGHWLYDRRWNRRPAGLPAGRAFASRAGAVVVLTEAVGDSAAAVLVAGGRETPLGRVAPDAEPAFTPTGERGALRTSDGVVVFERDG